MSRFLSAAQQTVFDQIDVTTFWAIAGAYRTEHQRGQSKEAAFDAAIDAAIAVLGDRFPTVPRGTIAVVARAVLARIEPVPLDWFWESVDQT